MKTDASLAQPHTHIVLDFSSMPGSKAGSAGGLGGGGEEGWVVVVAAVVVVVPVGPAEYIRAKEEKKRGERRERPRSCSRLSICVPGPATPPTKRTRSSAAPLGDIMRPVSALPCSAARPRVACTPPRPAFVALPLTPAAAVRW
jgi:hypothetical protein